MTVPRAVALDTRAFVEPLTRAEIDDAVDGMKRGTTLPWLSRAGGQTITLVLVAFFALVFVSVAVGIPFLLRLNEYDAWPMGVILVPLAAIGAGIVVWALVILVIRRRDRARAVRLSRFAEANGMTYRGLIAGRRPGMMFEHGGVERGEMIARTAGRTWEIGNIERRLPARGTRRGKGRWGVVAVQLGATLPHIVLDARGNNSILGGTGLPHTALRNQRVSLEGDFDRYFSLYCREGYERAALYLFTPDIMAMMIDRFAELDVEIVDDWLFLYSRRDLVTFDPAVWEWLLAVTAALETKLGRWERWTDDRMPPPSASPNTASSTVVSTPLHAPRLKVRRRSLPWALLAGGALVIAAVVISGVLEIIGISTR